MYKLNSGTFLFRKVALIIISLFISLCTYGQSSDILYGMTNSGGTGKKGTVYSYDLISGQKKVLVNFSGTNGSHPTGRLLKANDGMLYGTTPVGGSGGFGVLFRYNPVNGQDTVVLNFADAIGTYPDGALIQATDGMLYGMTGGGGSKEDGVLFKFNPLTFRQTVLINFNGTNGRSPDLNSIMQATDGMIYGTTLFGGSDDEGVLFRFNPQTLKDTVLFSFSDAVYGSGTEGDIVQTSDGLLHFVLNQSGDQTMMSYNISNGNYSGFTNYNHMFSDGNFTISYLDSSLYSIGAYGNNSCILNHYLAPSGTTTPLAYFKDTLNGLSPTGKLCRGLNGLFYGIANSGGKSNNGTLFSFNQTNNEVIPLMSFDTTIGTSPYDGVIEAGGTPPPTYMGKLYGTTFSSGSHGDGVLFSVDKATGEQEVLVDFDSINGTHPHPDIIEAFNGLIYGLTGQGGKYDNGTLYSFNPATGKQTVIYSFSRDEGANRPYGVLHISPDGWLYCAASSVCCNQASLFRFNPANNDTVCLLHPPPADVFPASNGKFYGAYGAPLYPILYSYDMTTEKDSVIFEFALNSLLNICPDNNGLFYVNVFNNGWDTLYTYNALTAQLNRVPGIRTNYLINISFIKDSLVYFITNGTYGTNELLNTLNINTGEQKVLIDLNSADGFVLNFDILQSSNGLFYGTTGAGGIDNAGTVYQYNPETGLQKLLCSFNDGLIYLVSGGVIELNAGVVTGNPVAKQADNKVRIYPSLSAGEFTIAFQNVSCNSFKIVDMVGREVYHQSLNGFEKNNTIEVNISNQPPGLYFVQFSGIGNIATEKIIIQK